MILYIKGRSQIFPSNTISQRTAGVDLPYLGSISRKRGHGIKKDRTFHIRKKQMGSARTTVQGDARVTDIQQALRTTV